MEILKMSDIYKIPENYSSEASMDKEKYMQMYSESINEPEAFWEKNAKRINWIKNFSKVKDVSFDKDKLYIKWFEDGTLNVTANCIDRHLKDKADKIALLWQGDDPDEVKKITYASLLSEVSLMSNILLKYEVKKGDRVTIYMPMIPEAVFAMLACARIGAIHSVVFGGFSPDSLADRIKDCNSDFVITAVRYVVRSNSVFCVYIPWYDTVLTAVLALAWERFWQKWRGRSSHDSRGHAELEQRLSRPPALCWRSARNYGSRSLAPLGLKMQAHGRCHDVATSSFYKR